MVFRTLFSRPLIDVIDWVDEPGVLAWRYPTDDRAIRNGAQLTVREAQSAAFMNEGQMADIFGPGLYTLETATLPLLTALAHWDKGFASPFKSDVHFFSLREQVDRRWGTTQPISLRDKDFGPIRLRAHGRYSFTIKNVALFWTALVGNLARFTLDDIEPQLRATILTALSSHLGTGEIAFLDMARHQTELSASLAEAIEPEFTRFGLALTGFMIESLSLPEEVQAAIDKGGANRIQQQPAADDPFEQIERLHRLMQTGALSAGEFEAKKADLLKRIG